MKQRHALVEEHTVHCEWGRVGEFECLDSGKYAVKDLTDMLDDGSFFCVGHYCTVHALAGLQQMNDWGGRHAQELGTTRAEAE